MPKVKFTALVSDMKGKANGSVFASNNGGTYFRTNKTGGGRKSLAWAANKNDFANISGQWKSLTDEQKQAWKDARTLYPTTNAFGDVRIPTAYELYMRLNGVLSAAGLDLLTTPETPRSMPDAADIDIVIPDQTVFAPKIITRLRGPQGEYTRAHLKDLVEGINFIDTQTISFRVIAPTNFKDYWVIGKVYQIASVIDTDKGGLNIFMKIIDATTATIYCCMAFDENGTGACTYIQAFNIPQDELLQQIHIVAAVSNVTPEDNLFYINGTLYNPDGYGWAEGQSNSPADLLSYYAAAVQTPTDALDVGTQNYDVYLGSLTNTYYVPFLISDFRFFGNTTLGETCSQNNPCAEGFQCYNGMCAVPSTYSTEFVPVYVQKLYRGYILGTELVAVSFTFMEGAKFPNACSGYGDSYFRMTKTQQGDPCDDCVGNDFECQDGECVYVGDHKRIGPDNVLTYGPLAALQRIAIDGEGFYMQLYYSRLISAGRSIEQVPYILAGTFYINENSQNISDLLLSLTGNFSDEGTYAFKCVMLDGTTGVVYDTQIPMKKPKKNVARFKAGADLSGKVN